MGTVSNIHARDRATEKAVLSPARRGQTVWGRVTSALDQARQPSPAGARFPAGLGAQPPNFGGGQRRGRGAQGLSWGVAPAARPWLLRTLALSRGLVPTATPTLRPLSLERTGPSVAGLSLPWAELPGLCLCPQGVGSVKSPVSRHVITYRSPAVVSCMGTTDTRAHGIWRVVCMMGGPMSVTQAAAPPTRRDGDGLWAEGASVLTRPRASSDNRVWAETGAGPGSGPTARP